MGWSRKHFALVARVVQEVVEGGELRPREGRIVAQAFAEELACVNEQFDRERFLTACGVNKEV